MAAAYAGFDADEPVTGVGDGVSNHSDEGGKPKRKEKGLDDEDFRTAVKSAIDDAVDYIDGFVAPLRAAATQYYRGEPLGNEEQGRSQIIMTELRDVVQGIMPGLLRLFCSGENAVEFVPTNANTVELAEQQTDYISHIFFYDNPGFLILLSSFKDALVRKTGVLKWYWSEETKKTSTYFSGITAEQVAVIKADKSVDKGSIKIEDGEPIQLEAQTDPQTGQPVQPPPIPTFDVTITRTIPANTAVVEALPPEEFLLDRNARRVATANYAGHRSYKTVSDLVALGYDQDEIEENMGSADIFSLNYEAQIRNPAIMSFMQHADNPDPSMRPVLYTESYVRLDRDGDGIAELWRVCTIGDAHYVLHDEEVDHIPFAVLCPDPEPHMVIGQSIADQTMDLQELKTNVVRNILDSLGQSIHPRTWIVEGQANIDDALNTEIGAVLRVKQPGMVGELEKTFVGQQALPLVGYLDDVRSQRTGMSQASQGLDADVLQSTTKSAVDNTVAKAQERIELIGRIFAQTGFADLFRGLLRLVVTHQDRARVLKLRGKWVNVDPRSWDADLECHANIAVGHGSAQEQIQFLMLVLQKQEMILQMFGPDNPLVTLTQYRRTIGKILNLAGIKDDTNYFGPMGPQEIAKLEQVVAQKAQQPNPEMLMVQVEQQKASDEKQIKLMKLQIENAEKSAAASQKQFDTLLNGMIQLAEIEAKYGVQTQTDNLNSLLTHISNIVDTQHQTAATLHGNLMNAATKAHGNVLNAAAQAHGNAIDGAVADRNNQMQADVAREAAAQQPAEAA